MKIYVMADMEGISGIHLMNQVKKECAFDYAYGRKLLMEEINYTVDTLFRLGADEVVVRDAHTGGWNIELAAMDGRAVYEPPCTPSLSMLDDSFDGVIILGQHSRAGTLNGFLDHTMNSMEWFEYKINGREAGEIAITAARAGAYDVPVLAVTGDEMAVAEAKELLGDVAGAVVKRGVGRNWADCLPIKEAYQVIADALEEGVMRAGSARPYKPELPAQLELTFYRSDYADRYNGRREWERVNARTVRKTITSFRENMW